MADPIQVLRGTVADTQDVLSAPDVDRAMAALAQVEALVRTIADCVWKQDEDGSVEMVDVETVRAALAPFKDTT